MAQEPCFLSIEQVVRFHREQLERYGGMDGIREPGLLESAVAQAQAAYFYGEQNIFDAAAAYLYHIAENQPFIDGNKRTATDAALTFLVANGQELSFDAMFPYQLCIAIAKKTISKQDVAYALEHGKMPE